MPSPLRIPAVTASVLLLACEVGVAQADVGQDSTPPVALTEVAVTLARSGIVHGDARAMLAAAQMLMLVERGSPGLTRTDDTATALLTVPGMDGAIALTATNLLLIASEIAVDQQDTTTAKLAAALANDFALGIPDPALFERLDRAARALLSVRGAVGASRWAEGHLQEQGTADYRIRFEGRGASNRVSVTASQRAGRINCYLFAGSAVTAADTPVATDEGSSDRCTISWTQEVEGEVTLRIVNAGPPSYFVLVTN